MKYHKNSDLSVTTKIWDKEIYGLVDFDNPNYLRAKIKINFSGTLSRVDKNSIFTKYKDDKTPFKLLFIDKNEKDGTYSIDCGTWSKDISTLIDQDAAFIIYKSDFFKEEKTFKNRYYKISQGDIFKIGKYYLKLLDMELFEEVDSEKENSRKTMIKTSSFNSIVVNGQEIIRGAFTPDTNNNQKVNFDLSSNLISNNDNSILSNNKYENKKNSLLSFQQRLNFLNNINSSNLNNSRINKSLKPGFYLPRINSSNELFIIKSKQNPNNKKVKLKNKTKIDKIVKPLEKQIKNKVCRICYGDDTSTDNPLISPCICKGSMKYIHYKCLKNWLDSKIESEIEHDSDENATISYNTKDFSCELCKTKFPDYIRINGKLYNIIFYKPKFQEFAVFESMRADKHKNKQIHIVSFDNKKSISLGRSSECEFSIPELSISRFHCIIHKEKGNLYIEDNKSKFGTLVLVQNNKIKINDYIPLKLQIRNTYIKIKMCLPFLYSCCNASTNDIYKNDYQIQNQENLDVFSYFSIKENNEKDLITENEEDEKEKTIKINNNKNNSNNNNVIAKSGNELIDTDENNDNSSSINKKSEKSESSKSKENLIDINNKKDENNSNNNGFDKKINIINIMSGEIKLKKKSKTVETNKNKNNNNKSSNQNKDNIINSELLNNTEKNKNINFEKKINNEIVHDNIRNHKSIIENNNSSSNTIKNIEDIQKLNNINLINENININNSNKSLKDEDNKKKKTKIMKKIKFKKDDNNLNKKEEHILPNINNLNNKEIENMLHSSSFNIANLEFKKNYSIQDNSGKGLNPINLQDTNLINNSNFNNSQNQTKNKIVFSKYNFFQASLASNSIVQKNRNNNNLGEQTESLLNPVSFIQKEKSENEKSESKEK